MRVGGTRHPGSLHWSGVCLIEPEHDKNQQNDLCTQRRLWSALASAQSDQSLLSALREARGPELSSGERQGLWSDWADAQADLSLRWPQRSFCWFCYVMAQLFSDNPAKSSRVVVPDQLPCFVVSYLGFHALPKSVGLNARLKWVKVCWILDWFDVVEPKWAATWQNQESECAPSEDSDQPGHQPSLIRVFAVHLMCS